MAISMMANVSAANGAVAQLCIKGIFLICIMCTIKVCDSKFSTNHAVKKALMSGELALKTNHINRDVGFNISDLFAEVNTIYAG